jgi:subtilisin family serine protease
MKCSAHASGLVLLSLVLAALAVPVVAQAPAPHARAETVVSSAVVGSVDRAQWSAGTGGDILRGPAASRAVGPAAATGLHGIIRDANTGDPLSGFVYLLDPNAPTVEYYAYADASGTYTVTDVLSGTYDVYGTMIGYYRVDATAVITTDEMTRLDFWLPAPLMGWDTPVIRSRMNVGEVEHVTLVISNTGSGDLLVRIDEVAPHVEIPPPAAAQAAPARVDPQVYAELAASPDGTAEILVVMAEQADLGVAYGISDWSARGRYVYDVLREAADRTQAQVRDYLDRQGIPYHSHVSLNALTLRAPQNAVDALAAMQAVATIQPATSYDLPEPIVETAPEAVAAIGWNIQLTGADRVWDEFGVTGEGIVVANIDTGVEWDHEALLEQYRGWNGITATHDYSWWDPSASCAASGFSPDEPCDNYWHGTHVMGTMVGSDDPTQPLSATHAIGMAPGARWMACKGCEMAGDWLCSTFALLECADFVLAPWDMAGANPDPDMRPHVVNNSWGGAGNDGWYSTVVAAWRAAGIFPAFSAGNYGYYGCATLQSPGDYPHAFTTGATDRYDQIAGFSSRGPSALGVTKPDVTAPGSAVNSSKPHNSYGLGYGTSMASPHSAGEAALILSAQPELIGRVQLVEWLIRQTADPLFTTEGCGGDGPDDVPNNVYGWGRINAHRAVSTALGAEWDVGWLDFSPGGGTLGVGETLVVTVTLDATNLEFGECRSAQLKLETNDPYQGLDVFIPVELCTPRWSFYLPLTFRDYPLSKG